MARIPRIVVPGVSHHVTQRGVRRQLVFFGAGDYSLYKALLGERAPSAGVTIRAYCFMPNHVHLIVVPEGADSLARLFRTVHSHYAELVNAKRGWTGHLWQQRFASFPMHEAHLRAALDYVHDNPVRAGIVERAIDWPWSSARAEHGLESDELVGRRLAPTSETSLQPGAADRGFDSLRACGRTGRPLGPPEFVRELEVRAGRPLAPQRRGPKPGSHRSGTGRPPGVSGFGELTPN
jgi:putative transposase